MLTCHTHRARLDQRRRLRVELANHDGLVRDAVLVTARNQDNVCRTLVERDCQVAAVDVTECASHVSVLSCLIYEVCGVGR
jgi:hypothetical protein